MSLDITLKALVETDVFSANITSNVANMADAAGIYTHLWKPKTEDIETAEDLIVHLQRAIEVLKFDPIYFRKLDSPNGWGTYDHFVPWLEDLLANCKKFPNAKISVWV